ncbi:MAG: chromosomal replication initiator protein DnaA [Ottowia sp.]|nr:chromosomal replication initiator protein DnaA [Ottowia sp.]
MPSHHTAAPPFADVSAVALWPACLGALAQEVPADLFDNWIRPLVALPGESPDILCLQVASAFKRDRTRRQFEALIAATLERLGGRRIDIVWKVPQQEARSSARPRAQAAVKAPAPEAAPETAPPQPGAARGSNRLNAQLTFENLVEGTANRMARAAGLHVANEPGGAYNPLFIYGGVGLGKTHLMHAVGNKLLENRPDAKVLYVHAEQFVSDVVHSYQRKAFDEVRRRYHELDLLLIDDVQFFAGKDKSQEEFFNAFESLFARQSQIVLTSDTYPKGLTDIHQRLVSRFDSGLSVALEPPEPEMRVAILMSKAAAEGAALPEDVAWFIARLVRSSVRELEGALHKVLAYARFNGQDISVPLAREALRDLLSIQNRQISVENIQKTVADFFKIKVADMYSKRRPAAIVRPRQIAMYLAREMTRKSLPEIGELFGGRDHSTVLHAANKIAAERQQQAELNQQLHVLEQMLRG